MTKYLLATVILAGCANTSPGTVTAYHQTGGIVDEGFSLSLSDAGEVSLVHDNGDPSLFGVLSDVGQARLDDLVASLPIDSASDDGGGCNDFPQVDLEITFDSGGVHQYHYSCHPGAFAGLDDFFSDISTALRLGHGDDLILVAQE